MKKEEYMSSLKTALQGFDEDLAQEIIMDYEERFRVGVQQGKTEEQVIRELGSVEGLIMELSEMQAMNAGGIQIAEEKAKNKEEVSGIQDTQILQTTQSNQTTEDTQGSQNTQSTQTTEGTQHTQTTQSNQTTENAQSSQNTHGDQTTENTRHSENSGGTYYQEKSFAESLDYLLKKVGKVLDETMKEAGKAVEGAMEQVEIHVEEAKRRRYNEENDRDFEHSEGENGEAYNVEMEGIGDETCRKVIIDARIADVNIRRATGSVPKAECHYYSHKTAMLYPFYGKQEGDCFYVGVRKKEETKSGFFRFNISPSIEIDVAVPSGMEVIELTASSGDTRLQELEADTVRLQSKSGNIEVSHFTGRIFRVEASSGDVSFEKSKVQSAEIMTRSGDCEVSRIEAEGIAVNTASGDINITGAMAEQVSLRSMSGEQDADDIHAQRLSITTSSGDIRLHDCRGGLLAADSASGDMEVRADFKEYQVKTRSGDISLESRHDANITADSASGDVKICILEAQLPYRVTTQSVSGECEVTEHRTAQDTGSEEEVRRIECKSISGDITVKFYQ